MCPIKTVDKKHSCFVGTRRACVGSLSPPAQRTHAAGRHTRCVWVAPLNATRYRFSPMKTRVVPLVTYSSPVFPKPLRSGPGEFLQVLDKPLDILVFERFILEPS